MLSRHGKNYSVQGLPPATGLPGQAAYEMEGRTQCNGTEGLSELFSSHYSHVKSDQKESSK